MPVRDLIIVGAGPSGLAAAIAAKQHGLDYHVLEQGTLVNSIYHFPSQMVFFTTPELMEIGELPFVSPYDKPTRAEALRYYRKVVDTYDLQIAFDEKVLAIAREADEPEPVFAVESLSARGVRRVRHARFVVLAIGYYDHPVRIGVPGEDLPHVFHYHRNPTPTTASASSSSAAATRPPRPRSSCSARARTSRVVHRHEALKSTIKYWVRPDIENRIRKARSRRASRREVREIRPTSVVIVNAARSEEDIPADAVFLLTGYRADADLMVRAGVELTERDAPRVRSR